MTLAGTGPGPQAELRSPPEGTAPPLVGLVWALLVVNTLGSLGVETIVPTPDPVLQMITMGSLGIAFMLALLLNPRLQVRPNAFLLLLTLLLVVSIVSSAYLQSGIGALVRCARLAVLIATLWLLMRWWDDSLVFVRHHLRVICAVLASVVVGLVVAPGLALPDSFDGRITGVLWPLTATQIGDYAAVVAGLVFVLWLARSASGWSTLGIALPAIALLLMSHTRTATVALIAGLAVAGLTLTLSSAHARRSLAMTVLLAGLIAAAFPAALLAWFRRGQGEDALQELTGRQRVWDSLLAAERSPRELLFGVGLTDKSFGGLPIDSSWLTVYHEQGLVGVAIVGMLMAGLIFAAMIRPPSPARACAVFLIVYCLVASYTQTGLGDASSYFLHVAVAAALLTGTGPTGRLAATDTSARTPA